MLEYIQNYVQKSEDSSRNRCGLFTESILSGLRCVCSQEGAPIRRSVSLHFVLNSKPDTPPRWQRKPYPVQVPR